MFGQTNFPLQFLVYTLAIASID